MHTHARIKYNKRTLQVVSLRGLHLCMQMKPSMELGSRETNSPNDGSSKLVTSQIWTQSGQCPVGTIPIRRVSREDISRTSSPSSFGRKPPHIYNTLEKAHQHKANTNSTAGKKHNPRPKNRSVCKLYAVVSFNI